MKTLAVCSLIMIMSFAAAAWAGVKNTRTGTTYGSINSAVADALSGDTLLISTGMYKPDWISCSSKNLEILGGYSADYLTYVDRDLTVIDGSSYGASFSVSTSLLDSVTLTGASHGFQANSRAIIT